MVKQCLALLLGVSLAACNAVAGEPLPKSVDDPAMKGIVEKLSDEDKKLLLGYLMRREMAKAFGGGEGLNDGVATVGDALDAQERWVSNMSEEEQRAEELKAETEAKRKVVAEQISKSITVAFIEARFIPSDFQSGQFDDFEELTFAIQNLGSKPIKAVKGDAVFIDTFGEEFVRVPMQIEESIAPREKKTVSLGMEINKFMDEHKKIMTLDSSKKFRFVPDQVVFEDGTTVKAPTPVS